jgi:hypothetical protein
MYAVREPSGAQTEEDRFMKLRPSVALSLSLAVSAFIAPISAHAGTFKMFTGNYFAWPLTGTGGTGCPTGPDGNTCVWPVQFSPVGFTYGGISISITEPSGHPTAANGNGNSCSATLDASFGVSLQWLPANGDMVNDPPPARVFLKESLSAWASGSGSSITVTADDGLGDASQTTSVHLPLPPMDAATARSQTPAAAPHDRAVIIDRDWGTGSYWLHPQASAIASNSVPYQGSYPGGCTAGMTYSASVVGKSNTLY